MSVLVYIENQNGQFKKSTFELLSYGKEIAKMISGDLNAVFIGQIEDDKLLDLGKYGVSKIFRISDTNLDSFIPAAFAKGIEKVVKDNNASVILFSNNIAGKALAPRLAIRLNAAFAAGVSGLPASVNPFVVQKKVYSGKAFAAYELNSDIKILSLNSNSYQIIEIQAQASIEEFKVEIPQEMLIGKPTSVIKTEGKVMISDADILVSAGLGLKDPQNWGMIEQLAEELGAATCCSRPVADLGWRPHHEHVGQTGKVVAPNLYIAIGISGAIQHLAGVNGSKVIVAINIDKEAPFFQAADYGIIGDAFEVVPALIEAVKKFKQQL
jgi:electron transfer flavoprotein alpha subunit